MDKKKIVGYILLVLGVAALALSYQQVRTLIKIAIPPVISDTYLTIGGAVLIILGFVLVFRVMGGKTHHEVPIYHGEKVVGFRRIAKS